MLRSGRPGTLEPECTVEQGHMERGAGGALAAVICEPKQTALLLHRVAQRTVAQAHVLHVLDLKKSG